MSMKPILFNTDMVKAILDGRKSCTRRIVKFLPGKNPNWTGYIKDGNMLYNGTNEPCIKKALYQTGDILYVRETWCKGLERYIYRADYSDTEKFYRDGKEINMKWHPSLHMPKDAARIILRVTNVRVERLQDITVEDALAEGMDKYIRLNGELDENSIITSFIGIWNSTIKKSNLDFYGWDANPNVWVIEFERCNKPEREGQYDGE